MNIGKATQVVKQVAVNSVEKMDVTPQKLSAIAEDVVSFSKEVGERTLTKLSKNVDFRPTGKEFKYVSLPKGLDIIAGEIKGKLEVPTVAIVDFFDEYGNHRFGKDIRIPHGKIVSKIMTNGLEDKIGVFALDVKPKNKSEWTAIREAIEEIVKLKKEGQDIKALNVSVGEHVTFEDISRKTKQIVSKYTIKEQRNAILNYLKKSQDKDENEIYKAIQAINKLVNNGIEVYTSSGNIGEDGFDLLSLSKAQHIVGANDFPNATKCFANETAKGAYKFKMIYDKDGNFKSAISDGLKFDIKDATKTPKPGIFKKLFKEKEVTVNGTSFSCPAKLNEDLKKIL